MSNIVLEVTDGDSSSVSVTELSGVVNIVNNPANELVLLSNPEDEIQLIVSSGSPITGGGTGVSDHGALTGLSDDDHTQYHNDARGDVRYYTKTQVDAQTTSNRARANHTGTQTAATISDFNEAVQDVVGTFVIAGANMVVNYDDAGNTLTLTSTGGGGGSTDPEVVRDTIAAALVGSGLISIAVNDAADTITISTTATANSNDAQLRDRSTHTGTQSADTVVDGTTNKAYTGTEKTKLAGVANGATANSTDANLRDRTTHTGTQSADTLTDGSTNRLFSSTEKTKLSGIATGATANSTDAVLLARANHTGTQVAATISDLTEAVQDIVGAFTSGTGPITVTYNDAGNTLTVAIGDASTSAKGVVQLAGDLAGTAAAPTVPALTDRAKLRGAWVTGTAYAVNDVVESGGMFFRITTAHTSSTAPNLNSTNATPFFKQASSDYLPLSVPVTLEYSGSAWPARTTVTSQTTRRVIYIGDPGGTGPTDMQTNDIWTQG